MNLSHGMLFYHSMPWLRFSKLATISCNGTLYRSDFTQSVSLTSLTYNPQQNWQMNPT